MQTRFLALVLLALLVVAVAGCSKEKVFETEYIRDTQIIELPPDTVIEVQYVYDTLTIHDTVFVGDTVETTRCAPNEFLAVAAMQYYTNPLVLELINQQFGYSDGWIFYLTSFQLEVTPVSAEVYDIYGYIDYWTPDWSAYYPLEFLWRVTHTGGDPADPDTWQMTDPAGGTSGREPGLRLVVGTARPAQ